MWVRQSSIYSTYTLQHLPQISPTRYVFRSKLIHKEPKTEFENKKYSLRLLHTDLWKRKGANASGREFRCGMLRSVGRFSYASRRTPRFLTFRDEAASTTELNKQQLLNPPPLTRPGITPLHSLSCSPTPHSLVASWGVVSKPRWAHLVFVLRIIALEAI
jgi:hypothetical protein